MGNHGPPRVGRTVKTLAARTTTTERADADDMGGGDFHPECDDRPDALAAMLVAAVRADTKPLFAPLYDSVYAAVRRAADRRAYADALWTAAARALSEARATDAAARGDRDDDGAAQSRLVRMLAEILSPARCALGLGPEAFATLLAMRPSP